MAQLLLRGMIVGIVAGLLAFGFARVYGEPNVDRAIAVEAAIAKAKGETEGPEIVSRRVQSTIGLLTGVVVAGSALGGLFALAFAICLGRFASLRPRELAALLGAIGFVAVYLVPNLKYPANPPSIGEPETIAIRTGLYFSMIAISLVATIAAFSLRRLLIPRLDAWTATLAGIAAFLGMIAVAYSALPAIDEVPGAFPAQVLWSFRIDSLAIQAILWGTIGVVFGFVVEPSARKRRLAVVPVSREGS